MLRSLQLEHKPNAPAGCLTREQLEQIVASLQVRLPSGIQMVQYSQTAPPNTALPWQQINCDGAPMGVVKNFTRGAWQ